MSRFMNVDQSLPERVVLGRGMAFPFGGWVWDADACVERIVLRVGSREFAAVTDADLRMDVFAALRPIGDNGRALASGFWGVAILDGSFAPGRYDVELAVTWSNGETSAKPLGPLFITEPKAQPALPATLPGATDAEPLIAICMATYNPPREAFSAQIESIRQQTYSNWICIIQDDRSSAEGRATIREVIGDDPRFLVEHNTRNLGPYRNFERSLERVPREATYVALSDQDDVWFPFKLRRLVDKLEQDSAMLVYSDQRIVRSDGSVISETYWTTRRNQYTDLTDLLLANTVTGAASLFRRELLDVALPFPPKVGDAFHDHWLACCALVAGRIGYVEDALYDYVQHGSNVLGHCPFPPSATWKLAVKTVGLLPAAMVAMFIRRLRPRVGAILTNMTATYYYEYRRLALFSETLRLRVPDLPAEKAKALGLFKPSTENHWGLLRRGLFGPDRQHITNHAELRLWSGLAVERATARVAPPALKMVLRKPKAAPPALGWQARGETVTVVDSLTAKVAPLTIVPSPSAPERVNIVLPELNLATFFGGYMAKINLAAKLVERGHRVRLLLLDQQNVWLEHLNVIQRDYCVNENIFDLIEVAECLDRDTPVLVNPRDRFIATTWWSAHVVNAALRHVQADRFLYLVQEYEPFTFAMGSYYAMAHESYSLPHDALYSTRLLEEYFETQGIGAFSPEQRAVSRRRFFDNAIVRPPTDRTQPGRKRKLLFYARPEGHAARNLFEIGWAALHKAIEQGVLPEDSWDIVTIGSPHLPKQIAGRPLENLGKKNLKEYREILRDYDVGMSLMYTPHPSLVPLEMAAAGMVVVTTTCLNKTEEKLKALSPNFIGAVPSIDGVADGLRRATRQAVEEPRERRIGAVNWPFSWDDTFTEDVLAFIEECLERQVPPLPVAVASERV